jgi:eukaryotic-like serine/threonine-protein kinase
MVRRMLSTSTAPSNASQTVLAATVAIDQSGVAPAGSQGASVVLHQSAARTTVLPRIEKNGAEAQLVFDGRERFEHLKVLGEGGIGEVVGALDHDIGRKVAIKRLKTDVRSPAILARFVEEIRTIGKLDHPNIIPIHDVGTDADGELYFVMKYVDGETLESIIGKLAAGDPHYHKVYTFERRVEIFRALLEALAFAHDKGVIHRDIKPANVMIGRFGEVFVMDWGVAKSLSAGSIDLPMPSSPAPASPRATVRAFETQLGSLIGTPLYMSPEQASGKPTDERSDVYCLCLLFYELLYLRHPLQGKQSLEEVLTAVRTEEVNLELRGHPHQPHVPAELGWFIRRGLEKDPAKRRQSVREMIDVLERRADGDICIDCPVTLMKSVTMRSTKLLDSHPVIFMLMMMGFTALFVTLVVFAVRGIA